MPKADKKQSVIVVRVTTEEKQRIQAEAAKDRRTVASFVLLAIDQLIKRQPKKGRE